MFKNFIKITLRNIATHKIYTSINILGLAIGIGCALLIAVYVEHECSYDRFHKDYDRIYRIAISSKMEGNEIHGAVSPSPMAQALRDDIDEIEDATRIARFGAWLVTSDKISNNEDNMLFADTNFFDIFSYEILKGNPDTALCKPNCVMLTESAVKKYFGDEDPMGKKLEIEDDSTFYTVTGIIKDLPSNTHIHFDLLGSLITYDKYFKGNWLSNNFYTYFKIAEGSQINKIEKKINGFVNKYLAQEVEKHLQISLREFNEMGNYLDYHVQKLSRIHLFSDLDIEIEANGKAIYVYTFAVIAVLILFIACLNFVNLATASSANRAREVAIRKVVGSERRFLILQFLTESVVFSLFGLLVALIFAELVLPYFNRFLHLNLNFSVFNNWYSIALITVASVIVGIAAGSYPAFFISSYRPVRVLHSDLNKGMKSKKMRSVFVVLQFTVSILIITLTLIVYSQVDFMLAMDLGFNKENVIVIRRSDALKDQIQNFKEEINRHPGIISSTNSNTVPGKNFSTNAFILPENMDNSNLLAHQIFVNYDYLSAYGLEMVKGRFFSPDSIEDSMTCVINETAALKLGLEDPIGIELGQSHHLKKLPAKYKVIGVVKDYYIQTVDKEITSLVIALMPGNMEGYINVRLYPENIKQTIAYIEEVWQKYTDYPFVYFFMDKDFNKNYESLIITGRVLLVFSVLAIIIACLGLFGLISYTANQRTREIGLRKALGSSEFRILLLMFRETTILVGYSSLIAWALAWILAQLWLTDFHNRIGLNPFYFLLSTILVYFISMITVSSQAIKAANINPGDALKYE